MNPTATPKRLSALQINNFWERNVAFMDKKKVMNEHRDKRYNYNLTFKPEITKRSR